MGAFELAESPFEREDVPESVLLEGLAEIVSILDAIGVPHVFVGGVASAVFGRSRWTQDIDVFVRPEDAQRALKGFADAGYQTHETYAHWLYKALKNGVLVDLIFQSSGGIYLDEEMLERAVEGEFRGRKLRLASPEDLVMMKALAHDEPTPRYWYDALAILATTDIDWDYLLRRARHGARRILSLLIYAQARDILVPDEPIRRLYEALYSPDSP